MSNDIVTRAVKDGVEFYTVNATGESGVSQRGLGRLCDVDESTIRRLFNSLRRETVAESLKPLLGKDIHCGEGYKYRGKPVSIVRAEICAAVIMHYVFEGNEVAKYSLQKFTAIGINTWIQGITGYVPQQAPQLPCYVYVKRLMYVKDHKIPFGYWSIFAEASEVLIHVEQVLKFPIEHMDLLDGSIGKHWAAYREGKFWAVAYKKYTHKYRDQRGDQEAKAYDDVELKYFRQWLDEVYTPIHLPEYLERKRKQQIKDQKKLNG